MFWSGKWIYSRKNREFVFTWNSWSRSLLNSYKCDRLLQGDHRLNYGLQTSYHQRKEHPKPPNARQTKSCTVQWVLNSWFIKSGLAISDSRREAEKTWIQDACASTQSYGSLHWLGTFEWDSTVAPWVVLMGN